MKKSIIKITLLILLIFTVIPKSFTKRLDLSIRNSSEKDMIVKLERKSDLIIVYKNKIPATRTIRLRNVRKGSYSIYYKYVKSGIWRIMKILILRPGKTIVLF